MAAWRSISGLGPRCQSLRRRMSKAPPRGSVGQRAIRRTVPLVPTTTIEFDNTFANELDGLYHAVTGAGFPEPKLVKLNRGLAGELGLSADDLTRDGAGIFSANTVPDGAAPLAQVYAGHQFGGFSPQLGDGRALLLGEVIDRNGERRDLQLKGSGPTPFSRGGDGKAALGPVLREYLMGEAMHGLGVPTTRALAAVSTGESVYRPEPLPGAVLARVAASHIRVGTFQYFNAHRETKNLRRIADYAIARHYPEHRDADNPYQALLQSVCDAQAELVASWMQIGFIHGVMNTDNVTISGETIDYGPCAFMDVYDPATVFSSIDRNGRYAFGNQPAIMLWNLARFAEALLPLVHDDGDTAVTCAEEVLESYQPRYQSAWLAGMRAKLGFTEVADDDLALAEGWLSVLEDAKLDFTTAFRTLSAAARGDEAPVMTLAGDAAPMRDWLDKWQARQARQGQPGTAVAAGMDSVNPVYIPRNHKTEEALAAAAEHGDLGPFDALLDAVSNPYEARPGLEQFAAPAPEDFGPYVTFCGT